MFVIVLSIFMIVCPIPNSSLSFSFEDIRNHLGTRTPYRFRYNKDDSKIKYPSKLFKNKNNRDKLD